MRKLLGMLTAVGSLAFVGLQGLGISLIAYKPPGVPF